MDWQLTDTQSHLFSVLNALILHIHPYSKSVSME